MDKYVISIEYVPKTCPEICAKIPELKAVDLSNIAEEIRKQRKNGIRLDIHTDSIEKVTCEQLPKLQLYAGVANQSGRQLYNSTYTGYVLGVFGWFL